MRVEKGGVENFLSWPSSCRDGCGSLFTAVLVYDACKGRKNLFKRSWKEGGKEQTETCPILMEQAPLQARPGNDALLLGEKYFFPKSQRQTEVVGENAQGAGKRLPGF